eukprot:851696_1
MSKKRKNPFMAQILKNVERRSRPKRKRPDEFESKHNSEAPPTKKMKFEKPLNRKQIVKELKSRHAYKGRSSWNKTDLTQYLQYLNLDLHVNPNHNVNDETEIPKDEFIKMPLFKLQSIYNFGTAETDRDGMYRTMQKYWKSQRERQRKRQQEIDKLLEPIISKFFIVKTNGTLCVKSHVNADTEKVLVFRDLKMGDADAIREFTNQNKLFFHCFTSIMIGGVGLMRDRSSVMDVLRDEESKRRDEELRKLDALRALSQAKEDEEMRKQDALRALSRAKEDEEWKKTIEKYALLRDGKNDIPKNKSIYDYGAHHIVFGEWIIKEDFGYGDKDEYYLYFNPPKHDEHSLVHFLGDDVYGSFLIARIEGKLKVQRPRGSNASYLNRKLQFDCRGRDIGTNELQRGDNTGEIMFSECGTLAEGVLFGFEFHALKISDDVLVTASQSDFDYDVEQLYEQERKSRWRK